MNVHVLSNQIDTLGTSESWGHVVRERKWTNARHVSSAEHSQNEEPQEEVEEVEIFHLCWLLLSSLFVSLSLFIRPTWSNTFISDLQSHFAE